LSPFPTSSPLLLPWSQLVRLNLSWTIVTNADVAGLVLTCPLLQSLNLEGCKHLDDGCAAGLLASEPTMRNLAWLSFFFVNRVTLRTVVALMQAHRGYWLTCKSYYGDCHDPTTLAQDIKDM